MMFFSKFKYIYFFLVVWSCDQGSHKEALNVAHTLV